MWVFPGNLNILDSGYATLDTFFTMAPWIFLFLVPAITMRSFAEEKRSGTLEFLLTKPLTDLQIILSKYLGGIILVFLSLLPCCIYFLSVSHLGNPPGNLDTGGIFGAFIGLFFLAAIYVSIGVFTSAISDNQIVSFILAVLLSFLIYVGFDYLAAIPSLQGYDTFIINLGVSEHYKSISRGVVDSRDIIYYLAIIAFFIVLTKVRLESRKWENNKLITQHILQLTFSVIIIILVTYISSRAFFRMDLTSEHRYTLSKETKTILNNIEDVVYIKIYLDGDLPAGFKKLRNSLKDYLDEFRIYGKKNIQYQFINPSESTDKTTRNKVYAEIYDKGLKPAEIKAFDKEGGSVTKMVFPGALISYNGVEMPVNFLHNNTTLSAEENLNNAAQTIEYELISTIHSLTGKKVEKIAFLEGQGELNDLKVKDISMELAKYFQVDRGAINGTLGILDPYKVVIVARPVHPFNERDKLVLDQYIMHGGKVIWFVDEVNVNIDSLASGSTFAFINNLNIDDQLFTYGVRINPNLLQDIQCSLLPVNTSLTGEKPQWSLAPWLYYPIFSPIVEHPVTRNLNLVLARFTSPLDTVGANTLVKKTFLLRSSQYCKLINVPVYINLSEIKKNPVRSEFNKKNVPVAVLLEGQFTSVFRNRSVNSIIPNSGSGFLSKSIPTRMIVVANGDMIANDIRMTSNGPVEVPLGYDQYTRQTFGNKDFIVNAINFLADESGLTSVRAKAFKLRILNKELIRQNRFKWQMINTLLPVILVIGFGFGILISGKGSIPDSCRLQVAVCRLL